VRVPRFILLPLFVVLAASAYYLLLLANTGNPYHGGTYRGAVVTDAIEALAVFVGVEVMRTERVFPIRAMAGAISFPLALVIAFTLASGVYRYVAA
jgi:hypothetical protein